MERHFFQVFATGTGGILFIHALILKKENAETNGLLDKQSLLKD